MRRAVSADGRPLRDLRRAAAAPGRRRRRAVHIARGIAAGHYLDPGLRPPGEPGAVADLLLGELERATVCPPDAVGSDVVTMNSRVVFRTAEGFGPRSAVMVYPEDYHPTGQHVSVMSPLGAAMLGIRAGERMPFTDLQGTRFSVTVEEVAYRP